MLADVTAPAGVRSILEHLGLATQALKRAPGPGTTPAGVVPNLAQPLSTRPNSLPLSSSRASAFKALGNP